MPIWLENLTLVSVIAYATLGGVFLAFSDFIMRALGTTDGGAEAMQAINREVFRIVFMTLFLGAVPLSLVLLVGALRYGAHVTLALAAVVYLVGSFAVTVFGNVPLNNKLAAHDAASPDGARYFTEVYLPRWTRLNTVRTGACLAASALALRAALSGA